MTHEELLLLVGSRPCFLVIFLARREEKTGRIEEGAKVKARRK